MYRSGTEPFADFPAAIDAVVPVRRSARARRLGVGFALAGSAAGAALAFLALTGGGSNVRPTGQLLIELDRLAVSAGFAIAEVRLAGHNHTSDSAIYAAIAPFAGGSLAGLDIEGARAAVEALPWVRTATIERILPDRLAITVTERTPAAVWMEGERRSLVDRTGRRLADVPAELAEALALLPVAGDDALLSALDGAPTARAAIAHAERIGRRRWALHLRGGAVAQMPPGPLAPSLEQLSRLLADGAAVASYSVIDLRLADRISVVPAARPAAHAPRG